VWWETNIIRDITPCSRLEFHRCFGRAYYFSLQGRKIRQTSKQIWHADIGSYWPPSPAWSEPYSPPTTFSCRMLGAFFGAEAITFLPLVGELLPDCTASHRCHRICNQQVSDSAVMNMRSVELTDKPVRHVFRYSAGSFLLTGWIKRVPGKSNTRDSLQNIESTFHPDLSRKSGKDYSLGKVTAETK
jgi:hypothetical protein